MIKIKNVSRLYTDGTPCKALDNVNLNLPEKGMVFIIGKSGSGKSTLLNILAGFDKPTSGEIYFNGENLKKFSSYKLDFYRNLIIGFVFQDFCLIDNLTVSQNIKLALNYQNKNCDKKDVNNILKSVDMEGYEKRLPKQLSAGQKQRIAIARALIKNPKVILADEPTGNLDSKTTIQILDLLKKISKERLVVVVSHSKEDAYKYADRIIEISNGSIVTDNVRNDAYGKEYFVSDSEILIPSKARLSNLEVENINEKIKKTKGSVKLIRGEDEFIPTTYVQQSITDERISKTKMGFKNVLKYSWHYFKPNFKAILLMVIIVTALITALSQSIKFARYDGELQFEEALKMSDSDIISIRQNSDIAIENAEYSNNTVSINQNSVDKIINKYDCEAYKVRNINFQFNAATVSVYRLWSSSGLFRNGQILAINSMLECDYEYLLDMFGENGRLELLAGKIRESGDGIIITDFAADSIISHLRTNGITTYDELIDNEYVFNKFNIKVNAIIKTNYKEEFGDLFDKIDDYENQTPEITNMFDLLMNHYAIAYTINPNYYYYYVQCLVSRKQTAIVFCDANFNNGTEKIEYGNYITSSGYPNLKNNEVIMGITAYNKAFGTNLTSSDLSEFVPRNIYIEILNGNNEVVFGGDFYIKSLTSSIGLYFAEEIIDQIIPKLFFQCGVYVKGDKDELAEITNYCEELGLYVSNSRIKLVKVAINVVEVFSDLFSLISLILIFGIIVLVIINSINTLHRNIYIIGVSRAMGAHMRELSIMFAFQILVFGVLVILLSNVSDYFTSQFINELLATNIGKIVDRPGVNDITYIFFNPAITNICTGLIEFLTGISILLPIIIIRLMNPVKIIKSRD